MHLLHVEDDAFVVVGLIESEKGFKVGQFDGFYVFEAALGRELKNYHLYSHPDSYLFNFFMSA
jgi:hypothetical protein